MSYEASVTIQANFARKGYNVIYKPSNTSFFISYELLTNVTDAEWQHAIYGGPDTLHMLLWKKEQDMSCNPYISHSGIPKFTVHKDEAVLPPPKFQKEKPKKSSVPWDGKKKSSADKLGKLVTKADWQYFIDDEIFKGPDAKPYTADTKKSIFQSESKLLRELRPRKPALVLVDLGEGMLVPKKFIEEVILAKPDHGAKYPSMDDLKQYVQDSDSYIKQMKQLYYEFQKIMEEDKAQLSKQMLMEAESEMLQYKKLHAALDSVLGLIPKF